MSDLKRRLSDLHSTIQSLMVIGGTPGLSLSVTIKGELVHQANYGVRDVENAALVTTQTIFPSCSLSKSITAAAIGILVEGGLATWDTRIKDIISSFEPEDFILREHTTLTDLLCHRSGMSFTGNLGMGSGGNVLYSGHDCMRVINSQSMCLPFRGGFAYNSTAYDILGEAVQALSGQRFSAFIQDRIFHPLGMKRTFLTTPPTYVADVSKCYNVLDDGSPVPIPCPKIGDDWIGIASGGMRSCADDLLKLYNVFVRSYNDQCVTGRTSTKNSPLKQVAHIMSSKVPMFSTSRHEISYALGWARVQLPNTMGHLGLNGRLMPNEMPVVGRGVPGQLVICHQGTLPGALAVVLLLPDMDGVVLVLSNSLALTDVPDWVSQLVLEEMLNVPYSERNDYLNAARVTVAKNLAWHPSVAGDIKKQKLERKKPKKLQSYIGTYVDCTGVFSNVVSMENGKLYWAFQGLQTEKYELTHLEQDTFTWSLSRNELAKRGRWVLGGDQGAEFWKAKFETDGNDNISSLIWHHDQGVQPVIYHKKPTKRY